MVRCHFSGWVCANSSFLISNNLKQFNHDLCFSCMWMSFQVVFCGVLFFIADEKFCWFQGRVMDTGVLLISVLVVLTTAVTDEEFKQLKNAVAVCVWLFYVICFWLFLNVFYKFPIFRNDKLTQTPIYFWKPTRLNSKYAVYFHLAFMVISSTGLWQVDRPFSFMHSNSQEQ